MDDVFSKAPGSGSNRTFKAKEVRAHFSPSYGVHRGLIKDPSWPPTHFPEDGAAMARRSLRADCSFQVLFDGGAPIKVTGDISDGGARFVAPAHASDSHVQVLVDDRGTQVAARAEILSCHAKGNGFEYRARIPDAVQATALWQAVFQKV